MASGSPSLKIAMRKYHMLTMKVMIVHASRYACGDDGGTATTRSTISNTTTLVNNDDVSMSRTSGSSITASLLDTTSINQQHTRLRHN